MLSRFTGTHLFALTHVGSDGGYALPSPRDPKLQRSPWLALAAGDAVELHRPHVRQVRQLPSGTEVCLVVDQPLARWRLRRLAARSGVAVIREAMVVPSTRSPLAVIDDNQSAVAHFWNRVATVPPGRVASALPLELALGLARRLPWTWTGRLAPGRVLIGRTS